MANSQVNNNYIQNCVAAKKETIIKTYRQLQDLHDDFKTYARKIRAAKEKCDKKALSVYGLTLQESFEEIATKLDNYAKNIDEYASSMESNLNSVVTSQNQRIQDYLTKSKEVRPQLTKPNNQNISRLPL